MGKNIKREYGKGGFMYDIENERLFQDQVMEKLNQVGIHLQLYSSVVYQFTKGESIQGVEIKHDHRMKSTGNLYIEYQELDKNNHWCNSGILRSDNSWLYCIGDNEKLYLISKQVLINMYNNMKNIKKVETETSRGFLLPIETAKKWGKVI